MRGNGLWNQSKPLYPSRSDFHPLAAGVRDVPLLLFAFSSALIGGGFQYYDRASAAIDLDPLAGFQLFNNSR